MRVKPIRIFVLTIIIVLAVIVLWYITAMLVFSGAFDTKYPYKEMVTNFREHKKEFEDVVTFFNSKVPEGQDGSFRLCHFHTVSLIIDKGRVENGVALTVGTSNVYIDSQDLDSVLKVLNWDRSVVHQLKDKLEKTHCDYIRMGNGVEMFPYQSGWGSFTYRIFNAPLSDTLIKIHGKPIDSIGFGSRVALDYSSAL